METKMTAMIVWQFTAFKSYYVVWKPKKKMTKNVSVDSLNRTM